VQIRRNHDRRRFELHDDGELVGVIDYRPTDESVVLVDTEVAARHERLGAADFFVRKVFDQLRADGQAVVVDCPFLGAWLRRHPEYQDLVA
jgi:predicted GNAT family acetyltransferase